MGMQASMAEEAREQFVQSSRKNFKKQTAGFLHCQVSVGFPSSLGLPMVFLVAVWKISQAFQLEYEELCNEVPWSRSQELLSFGLNLFRLSLHGKTLTHLSSSIPIMNPGSLDYNHFFLKGARVAS